LTLGETIHPAERQRSLVSLTYAPQVAVRLTLQAHPGARHERIELLDPTTVAVWVRARPVEGQANTAIEQALAQALHLRPREVKIVAGGSSRRKIVEIALPSLDALRERLLAYGLLENRP
jgi:uncharacterized protein YggU (UPF0235/DUF167 family)